jgi:tetrahydromethanopterin S-methyltransferase subunit G
VSEWSDSRLDDLNRRFDALGGRVDLLGGRVDHLSGRVEELSKRVDDLSRRVDHGFTETNGQLLAIHRLMVRISAGLAVGLVIALIGIFAPQL